MGLPGSLHERQRREMRGERRFANANSAARRGGSAARPNPVPKAASNAPREEDAIKESAARADNGVTHKLPAAFDQVCVGGSGRFLIFHMQSLGKLAIFDVAAAKIAGYVATGSDDVLYTAGADKLVVVHPKKRILQRYSLTTRKLEDKLDVMGRITSVALGSASRGPLLVNLGDHSPKPMFLNLKTLKPIDIEWPEEESNNIVAGSYACTARASAQGRVFVSWLGEGRSGGLQLLRYNSANVKSLIGQMPGASAWPDGIGERIYIGREVFDDQMTRLDSQGAGAATNGVVVPAVLGPFYVRVESKSSLNRGHVQRSGQEKPVTNFAVCLVGAVNPWWRSKTPRCKPQNSSVAIFNAPIRAVIATFPWRIAFT